MDKSKVSAVLDWEPPKSVKEVQRFLEFANFYHCFISNYSGTVAPLTNLTKKNTAFEWSNEAQLAFFNLKALFTLAPVLAHPQLESPFFVKTDASDFALGTVLSQQDDNGIMRPIAYHSWKLLPAEINYEVHDKELLAIIDSFHVWRPYLMGAAHTVTIYCNHKNLEYFMSLH